MASNQEIRRRSSAADRAPYDNSLSPMTSAMAMSTTFSPTPDSVLAQVKDDEISRQQHTNGPMSKETAESMPPPPRPCRELPSGRRFTHARAQSMASSAPRQANRLSLTLPIAPPSRGDPVRPPSSAGPPVTLLSKPPTPAQTPVLPALEDANDFIIAIAAQERKVLELREELARAEGHLTSLKAQWTSKESMHKRSAEIQSQALASPKRCPTPDAMMSPTRQSVDLDRRKLWLQSQQSSPTAPSTPTQSRRKVMRGGHARTLSLLSPSRSDAPFNLYEDRASIDSTVAQPLHERTVPPLGHPPALSKRATWQPQASGVFPLVEDFKLGLRAFVEDIRQITVGDEPITGPAPARPRQFTPTRALSNSRRGRDATPTGHDGQSSASTRCKAKASLDAVKQGPSLSTADEVVTLAEKTKTSGKGKQLSWTLLGFETLEDNDWTNWDSPASVKSSRWSGSTAHNGGLDEIEAIPEKPEESATTPTKSKRSSQDSVLRNTKLDELLPSMVNRLSPSNLKRTANNLMDEWEKSLTAPETRDKENSV
ncbi:hypothetical protein CCM_03215 [Cordyceps militaris CM01]|uniref:DUF4048 domain-containing protein n=1 Tax=Cordyceps militaris (strain CM01) TaxID=983644 RepID=G3J9G6_CORMM|nr:uncharacterized protein CCM_03215 [Cordyceps militaris CM01]EGX94943.1 hypothetical protein CCM_03215 [Cordyceps militaris CM01]